MIPDITNPNSVLFFAIIEKYYVFQEILIEVKMFLKYTNIFWVKSII